MTLLLIHKGPLEVGRRLFNLRAPPVSLSSPNLEIKSFFFGLERVWGLMFPYLLIKSHVPCSVVV